MNQYIIYNNQTLTTEEFIRQHHGKDTFCNSVANIIKGWIDGQKEFSLSTSGSTGKARTISFTREQLQLSANQTIGFFRLQPGDNLFLCLPVDKVAGFMMVIRALTGKMNLLIEEPSSLPLQKTDNFFRIDFSAFIPFQLENILLQSPEKLKLLSESKAVIIGGNAVSPHQKKLFEQLEFPVYETYGMTETLTHIAVRKLNSNESNEVFQLLPGNQIRLNQESCLEIKNDITYGKWLKTNDIAQIFTDNTFIIKGRKDFVINSGGIKITPEEIEKKIFEVMQKHLPGKAYFLTGIPSKKYFETLCLLIESEEAEKATTEKILSECNNMLQKYERIKKICFLKSFVRTENGKINRPETHKLLINERQS